MSTVLRSDYLHYQAGNSDKVYRMRLVQNDNLTLSIIAEYGRRGSVLKTINKGNFINRYNAAAAYDKLQLEKRQKGYTDAAIQATTEPKKKKLTKKQAQLQQNIEDGIRRIDFDL